MHSQNHTGQTCFLSLLRGTRHTVQFSSKARRQSTSMSQSQNQCCVKHRKGMNAMPPLFYMNSYCQHRMSQANLVEPKAFPVLIFLPHSSLQSSLLTFFSASEITCQRQSKLLSSFFCVPLPPLHLNPHYILSVCPPVCATMCSFEWCEEYHIMFMYYFWSFFIHLHFMSASVLQAYRFLKQIPNSNDKTY